jgi:hypothetical protein
MISILSQLYFTQVIDNFQLQSEPYHILWVFLGWGGGGGSGERGLVPGEIHEKLN